jgi:hypothetical protein
MIAPLMERMVSFAAIVHCSMGLPIAMKLEVRSRGLAWSAAQIAAQIAAQMIGAKWLRSLDWEAVGLNNYWAER